MGWGTVIGGLLAAFAMAGIGYQLVALVVLHRTFARPPRSGRSAEPVTILKPLYGAEPRLADNLATFLAQDHPGPTQLVCGVASTADPAAAIVRALIARHPQADITLAIDPTRHGSNGKVGNLVNMLAAARHDTLVLSDSDMAVRRDYLDVVLAALASPGVGAVSCFYRGRGDAGVWSVLAAGAISYCGLPGIVIGQAGALAAPCMGSTIALGRDMLAAIGGFARFADVLADDYAIGQAVLALDRQIVIPPMLLVHGCAETSLAALWRHQLRWATTLRSLRPLSYLGLALTNPLPWALLTIAVHPRTGVVLAMGALVIRGLLAGGVDRIAGARSAPLWLLPAIDCLEFVVFLASFGTRTIDWRGSRLTMTRDGGIDDARQRR